MPNAVWNWTADLDTEREGELQELRGTVEELRASVALLDGELGRARRREREVREALAELAACRMRRRRRLIAALRARKLLET
jgi:prefoldin subunit 5